MDFFLLKKRMSLTCDPSDTEVQSGLPAGTDTRTLGSLFATVQAMSFANVLHKEGKSFNWNTAYIVPDSVIPESSVCVQRGGTSFFYLMFTTFLLSLEYYRVLREFGTTKGVTLSLDHTFKVSYCLDIWCVNPSNPHLCINVRPQIRRALATVITESNSN